MQLSVCCVCVVSCNRVRGIKAVMFRMIMELLMMTQTITCMALNAGMALSLVSDDAFQSTFSMTHAYELFTDTSAT